MTAVLGLRRRVRESKVRRARLTRLTDQAQRTVDVSAAVTIRAANRVEAAAIALVQEHEGAMDAIARHAGAS